MLDKTEALLDDLDDFDPAIAALVKEALEAERAAGYEAGMEAAIMWQRFPGQGNC